nr:MAG TPA: hypothetical protein [Caudoviricetes sp.]
MQKNKARCTEHSRRRGGYVPKRYVPTDGQSLT